MASRQTPLYEATGKVFIGPGTSQQLDVSSVLGQLTFSREFVSSYAALLSSRTVAERVVEELELKTSPAALAARVRTRIIPNTHIIEIAISDPKPNQAAVIVNAFTQEFVDDVEKEFSGRTVVKATRFDDAVPPTTKVSPRPLRSGIVGGFLGALFGAAAAIGMELFDSRIRNREDAEHTLAPLPILAEIPMLAGGKREFFIEVDPKSPTAEAFRILRTNVQFLGVDRPLKRILVTSPHAEDGKTTVAANLAASLAVAGYQTVLVEADLRRPTVDHYFKLDPSPGLSDVLVGRRTLAEAIRKTHFQNLSALTSGPLPPNPSELLGSQRMVDLIDEASAGADILVIDTPPTLPVTDAAVLAPRTDGVILVVRAGRTDRERAKATVAQFERAGVRVLGVVLNGVSSSDSSYYYYYYGHSPARAPFKSAPREGTNGAKRVAPRIDAGPGSK